jgi:surfeit locus 1 family protein
MGKIHFQFWRQRYVLKFNPGFILVCAVVFALFCYLGEWQIHRYHFKQDLLRAYQQNKLKAPLPFSQIKDEKNISPFQRVAVDGHYINELTVLLQNRPYKDQIGFEVITPLKIGDEKFLLLVDRGWVAGNPVAPAVKAVKDEQQISGEIKLLNERQFILGKNILNPAATPLVMQKMDVKELENVTHQEYYPYLLRLSADRPNGFIRDWVVTVGLPERHLGYAVQWFVMGLALLIACFCFCCEKIKGLDDAKPN